MVDVLAVFAKAPVPGHSKTRLSPPLAPGVAAALYEASLHDVVIAARSVAASLEIHFDPRHGADSYFAREFGSIRLRAQSSGDLGARLRSGFTRIFAGGAMRAVVIGADSPTLPPHLLTAGFEVLARKDVVLGPTTDGGYYLVGIRASAWPFAGAIFEGIPWSTADVLDATVAACDRLPVEIELLQRWYDIDDASDLAAARADARPGSNLARFLSAHPMPSPEEPDSRRSES